MRIAAQKILHHAKKKKTIQTDKVVYGRRTAFFPEIYKV